MDYIETDCKFEHQGKTFEAGGAVVNEQYAIGYFKCQAMSTPDMITDWHGKQLSSKARVTASWPIFSCLSHDMYQIEATIDGIAYTGRTLGDGMIWRGKRMAGQ